MGDKKGDMATRWQQEPILVVKNKVAWTVGALFITETDPDVVKSQQIQEHKQRLQQCLTAPIFLYQ